MALRDSLTASGDASPPTKFLIIDTDCGVDDALAILLATSFPQTQILAITCCHGNVSLDLVATNVFRVLQLNGKQDIPVYNGCGHPLVRQPKTDLNFHGNDGFGNVGSSYPKDEMLEVKSEHAVQALIRLAAIYRGQITLLALGPLTNIAMAQRIDPEFSKNLHTLVFMGGNITGLGNIDICTEFNFHCDPEAAFVVLNEFSCRLVCIPWEPCLEASIPWNIFDAMIAGNSTRTKFLRHISALTVKWIKTTGFGGYFPCDLYAAAYLFNPNVACSVEERFATVELQGSITAGEMIVDYRSKTNSKPNVLILTKFNQELLFNQLHQFFSN